MSGTEVVRFLRAADEPLGLFLRPGRSDHRLICQLLSEGKSGFSGAVFDPTLVELQQDLKAELNQRRLWSVLDPFALELSHSGSRTERRRQLPWAGSRLHSPADLRGQNGKQLARSIAEFVKQHGFSAVLAPTHYLRNGISDPWFDTDLGLAAELKSELASCGCSDVPIYYPLAIPTNFLFDTHQRTALKKALKALELDALWLRVHPFGGGSGHVTLQRYIHACRDLHELRMPLVAEKAGSIGIPLLVFGAVSGIELGVSSGEKFDIGRFEEQKKKGKQFAPHRHVYMQNLGVFLKPSLAQEFLENRVIRGQHQCANPECCRRGAVDMVKNPRRHFLISRMTELAAISSVPTSLRASLYLDRYLRPATDKLGRAAQAVVSEDVKAKMGLDRRKLDGWRETLGQMHSIEPLGSTTVPPSRRITGARA